MNRICVIDIAGLSMRLLEQAEGLWLRSLASPPAPLRLTFPAVTASVHASMTTGEEPGAHGVISGGLFRRLCKAVSLDERSNTLLTKKRFWHARALPERPSVSLLMWSNPLAGAADYVLGATTYGVQCESVVAYPRGLYDLLSGEIGELEAGLLRGPDASWRVSRWIGRAAECVWRIHEPDLQWVYLPGVSFEQVRHGAFSAEALSALREIDAFAKSLAEAVQASGGQVIVVSNGGYVNVSRVCRPNLLLKEAGLVKVHQSEAGEQIDLGRSAAFALVDHQVAHVFCENDAVARQAAEILSAQPEVAAVGSRDEFFQRGLGHDRAGERIAAAASDAWFSYAWWKDNSCAPAGAAHVDMPGKCGHDPCELLGGGDEKTIRPDAALVRASRGLTDIDPADQGILAATCPLPFGPADRVTDLPEIIRKRMFA